MQSALIDAGPLIALFDRDDQHHERVLEFMKEYSGRLISTWPVLTEVCYMLDFNNQVRLDFLNWVNEGGIDIFNLDQWQISRIIKLINKYSDLPADLADTTLIVAAETTKVEQIISLDRDFDVYQMNNRKHFINLLQ